MGLRPAFKPLQYCFKAIVLTTLVMSPPSSLVVADQLPENVTTVAAFEQSLWVNNASVSEDPFYTVPEGTAQAVAGSVLKVENHTDVSGYSLPSATSLSRLLYQTQTLSGELVPASAFILWPYVPRLQPDGKQQVVVWAHGSSGLFANYAPSHYKTLYQHFLCPYTLALQGYVVVAPDYAGLGPEFTADGHEILHQFVANPAHANDVFYSVQASQEAFADLAKEFVVIGHSQGGGAAWGAAQRQAVKPVEGYLGAVAACPVTNFLELPDTGNPLIPLMGAFISPTLEALYESFHPKDIFTEKGWEEWSKYLDFKHGIPVATQMLIGFQLMKDDWKENIWVKKFVDETSNWGKRIGGPLLVLQGEADPNMNVNTTTTAVEKLMEVDQEAQVKFVKLPGLGHNPTLYGGQRTWLDWIAERFAGVPHRKGLDVSVAENLTRSLNNYQGDTNWLISQAQNPYELA